MRLIKKYLQGNPITIPLKEGYEIRLAKDIKPGKHTMVNDPEYGEIPFETYLSLFPNDYFYVRLEENDPEQLIIEPTASPHRMAWYRVPYYDLFKFAKGYNQFDAERRNNTLSGSLYRSGNPDPTDNALNSALTGVTGLTRYGWKEAGKLALKGLNLFGKALTPSTYTTALFGTGFNSTMAGLGLDAATFGSVAYGSVKDMIDNGVNVENLLGATMSIPAVASAYKMYTTAKTGRNLYNLINAMNKALEDPEFFTRIVNYKAPLVPFSKSTNVYNASPNGYISNIKMPTSKHIHLSSYDENSIKEALNGMVPIENSPKVEDLTPGSLGHYRINLPTMEAPSRVKVKSDFNQVYFWPDETPTVPFLVGYRRGDVVIYNGDFLTGIGRLLPPSILFDPKAYIGSRTNLGTALIRRNYDGSLELLSVHPEVTSGETVGALTASGLRYSKTKDPKYIDRYNTLYDYYYRLGHAMRSDSPITSVTDPRINENLLDKKIFDMSRVSPEEDISAQGMYNSALLRKNEYINSDFFKSRFEKALGRRSLNDYENLNTILNSPLVNAKTTVTEGFPAADAGISTYYSRNGHTLFKLLQDAGIISKDMTREQYLESVPEYYRTAFINAENKVPQITLTESPESSAMGLADEELDHILRISDHPLALELYKYNKPYLDKMVTADVTIASDVEKATRAALINQNKAKVDPNKAAEFFKNKFHRDFTPEEVDKLTYLYIIKGDKKFYRLFGLKYNKAIFDSLNYDFTPDFIDALNHIVYNEGSESLDSSMA